MQKQTVIDNSKASLEVLRQLEDAASQPVALDPADLAKVGGGLGPNGTWSATAPTPGPNGTW